MFFSPSQTKALVWVKQQKTEVPLFGSIKSWAKDNFTQARVGQFGPLLVYSVLSYLQQKKLDVSWQKGELEWEVLRPSLLFRSYL